MSPSSATREIPAAQFVERITAHPSGYIKLAVTDIDGILRGKYLSAEKAVAALPASLGFCDVIVGWDCNDVLYDNTAFTGWHTGYPDLQVRLLPATLRSWPWEDGIPFVLAELSGAAEEICPRSVLRRVLQRAATLGYQARAGFEYEFTLFGETPDSLREKAFRGLRPITPGNFGYSVLRDSVWSDFHRKLLETCRQAGICLEGLHSETGPGVIEAALKVDDALEAADRAVLFKTAVKIIAQRHNLVASFMAKWSNDLPGHGGHIHCSLRDRKDEAIFHDESAGNRISATMLAALAGQQQLLPEVLALVAPTINSYKRLVPGYWAPTSATWGIENRTAALRAVLGSPQSQRIEYRVPGADANPYLALAAAIGTAIYGIEHHFNSTNPVSGNAYQDAASLPLPRALSEATEALRKSERAREIFGEGFVSHYCATRDWEVRQHRSRVTEWDLERYLEII